MKMKIMAFGEVMLRMMPPHYKKLTQVNTLEFLYTGTGVNVLSGLYQMGEEVYLATRLPAHIVGQAAASEIRKLGIKDDFICYGGQHMGIYFLEQGFGNRASEVTYLNRSESSFCQSQISDYDFTCLDDMDALHICGISLAFSSQLRDVVMAWINAAKERGVKVIFDCNFRPSLWTKDHKEIKEIYEHVLSLSDIVFAGYQDATQLLQIESPHDLPYEERLAVVLKEMCRRYHIERIFGTIRQEDRLTGYMVTESKMIKGEAMPLTVLDRVGGGDGFAAGAIHGYFHQMSDAFLVQFATASGVLAHTTYGDSPILSKETIMDYIEYGPSDIKR